MIYFCCDDRRRANVRQHPTLNGIDYLEVVDTAAPPNERQKRIRIQFVKPPTQMQAPPRAAALTTQNVVITGGERIRNIQVDGVGFNGDVLEVHVTSPGDFSTYTLHLVETSGSPLIGLDAQLADVDFSFKVECPTDLDCQVLDRCPPVVEPTPEIDYLARDYNSFRQLMLDRLSVLSPEWKERNPADIGIALVEMLAYVGDQLSYRQDIAATEAYLGTARRRSSVRKHVRLMDYRMHDGCNARVWAQIKVNADTTLPQGTPLLTKIPGAKVTFQPGSHELDVALQSSPFVFETMHDIELFVDNNTLAFYTGGDRDCCLPKGAVKAALQGSHPHLRAGDVLLFQEKIGPKTGLAADADPQKRCAVRLTSVDPSAVDLLFNAPITEIQWGDEDALPFPLCLSATTDEAHGGKFLSEVSAALGNIALADHGRTIGETLPRVDQVDPRLERVPAFAGSSCHPSLPQPTPPRYRPRLTSGPLTFVGTIPRTAIIDGRRRRLSFDITASASSAMRWDTSRALAAMFLDDDSGRRWFPQRDLLASDEFASELVAETEEDGMATLRFGDDEYGMRPSAGAQFQATCRIGNGKAGNIGAESLLHIVTPNANIAGIANPMAAQGGVDVETNNETRRDAPYAFRIQQRAVTPEDYAEVAQRHPQVQRAAATFRWTRNWHTVFLSVDRVGGRPLDAAFRTELRRFLERFRMAGHDLEIEAPIFVSLEMELFLCVLPDFYRSDVLRALQDALSNHAFPDGKRGLFHPDNFTFGQNVYLSPIVAAAQSVQGVRYVEVRKFQRQGIPSTLGIDNGVLVMGRLEVARLDNDPNFAEHGLLTLDLEGGR